MPDRRHPGDLSVGCFVRRVVSCRVVDSRQRVKSRSSLLFGRQIILGIGRRTAAYANDALRCVTMRLVTALHYVTFASRARESKKRHPADCTGASRAQANRRTRNPGPGSSWIPLRAALVAATAATAADGGGDAAASAHDDDASLQPCQRYVGPSDSIIHVSATSSGPDTWT
jgi:hypothetical protein